MNPFFVSFLFPFFYSTPLVFLYIHVGSFGWKTFCKLEKNTSLINVVIWVRMQKIYEPLSGIEKAGTVRWHFVVNGKTKQLPAFLQNLNKKNGKLYMLQ